MQAAQIIEQIQAAGGQLALINGGLMGKKLDQNTRELVKKYKPVIINLLAARQRDLMVLGYPCTCRNILYRQRAYRWRDFDNRLRDGYQCPSCGTRYKFV